MKVYKKKQILIILAILLCSISFVIVFGRYVTNSVNNFFLRSKEFYFYSDKLSEKRDVFQVDNWSGVDDYTIVVNMNSRKNNIQVATYDIAYDIKYTEGKTNLYQLVVYFPENYNQENYQDIIELIEINVNGQQVTGE